MPTARGYITANAVNGRIYIIGGDSNGTINEAYDPATDSWITKAPMPTGSYGYASAVVDNKIYLIDSNLNQIYNVETDTWSQGASPPSRVGYGAAGATTGENALKRIYVLSEYSWEKGLCLNQVYDPQHDSWGVGDAVPTTRRGLAVAVANDILYVIGGFTETFDMFWNSQVTLYATNEQYTPVGYGTPDPSYDGTAPEITVASPENKTYYAGDVALNFTVNEPVSSMRYELDGETLEISGNTTLTELSYGAHNITVYAVDVAGNTGASETIYFTVTEPEPFPASVAVASTAVAAVLGVSLAVYLTKTRRTKQKTKNASSTEPSNV